MPVEFIGMISTRDQSEKRLNGGPVSGHDAEQRADGDHLTKDERYARTDEHLNIVKLAWTESRPFDHHGQYYQVENHYSGVKSAQQPRIRPYFGGSSEAAYRVGGKHADTYALWGEPLAECAGAAA